MATMMGNQYGPCVGEVLPQTCDSCLVTGDQDCSGTSTSCVGDHVWSKQVGSANSDLAYDVLQLPNGEVIAVGQFTGTLVSGSSITSDGGFDAMWLRFDEDGNAISAKDWGGTGTDNARFLVQMDDGYVVAGVLGDGSTETFGAAPTLTAVGSDGYIAKFNSNHNVVWKKLLGGTSNDAVEAVVRMPDNGVAVVGRFAGTINLGGSNLTSLGFDDIYIARFEADGDHMWSARYGTNMQNNVGDLAVGPSGELVMVGEFATGLSFGGPTLNVAGGIDGFVVKFDQNGVHQWSRGWHSTGNERPQEAVVLSDGSVWVGGQYDTAVDLNGVAGAESTPTGTGNDLLVVKYDSAGTYQTRKTVNCTDDVVVRDMEVGFDDGIVLAGTYSGTFFTAMIAAPAAGSYDAWMMKISPSNGTTQWAKKYGGTSSDAYEGVHVGACGDVFAMGDYVTSVNFGGGALPNDGGTDSFVAKYRQ